MKKNIMSFVTAGLTVILTSSCSGNLSNMVYNEPAKPLITEVNAAGTDDVTFKTEFDSSSESRANNIALAANSINGVIVKPGETFSYNAAVGSTTKERGYKKAKVFIKGKESEGLGGGICQVSSTLYNAALLAGMEIVERHPHSKRVYYVEPGKDAAVSPGGVDMKFVNNKDYSVLIEAFAKNGQVEISLKRI